MKTVKDFADLLGQIKRDEFGTCKYKVTEQQLLHFSNAKVVPNRYKTFLIRKKSGGTREINAPCYQLGVLLYITNILFKAVYTPSSSVMGFTEGKSVVDNAKMHANHHYVFNIDLKDFSLQFLKLVYGQDFNCPPLISHKKSLMWLLVSVVI